MSPRILALLVAGVFAPLSSAQDDAAKTVLDAAIKAHGGKAALDKYKAGSSTFTGQITIANMDIDFKGAVTHEVPGKFHMAIDVDVGGVKQSITQVVNGKSATMTVNGTPTPVSDAQKAELMRAPLMQEVAQLTPLLDAKKYKLEAEKDADVDGKAAAVVRVQGTDPGLDVRLYFDKKSSLLVKTSRKGLSPEEKEVLEESLQGGFKEVGGVQVPMKVTVTHDGKKFMAITVTEAKVLEKADPKLFRNDL